MMGQGRASEATARNAQAREGNLILHRHRQTASDAWPSRGVAQSTFTTSIGHFKQLRRQSIRRPIATLGAGGRQRLIVNWTGPHALELVNDGMVTAPQASRTVAQEGADGTMTVGWNQGLEKNLARQAQDFFQTRHVERIATGVDAGVRIDRHAGEFRRHHMAGDGIDLHELPQN